MLILIRFHARVWHGLTKLLFRLDLFNLLEVFSFFECIYKLVVKCIRVTCHIITYFVLVLHHNVACFINQLGHKVPDQHRFFASITA